MLIRIERRIPAPESVGTEHKTTFQLGDVDGQLKCFNLEMSWKWVYNNYPDNTWEMRDICFNETENNIQKITDFKRISVKLSFKEDCSVNRGSRTQVFTVMCVRESTKPILCSR